MVAPKALMMYMKKKQKIPIPWKLFQKLRKVWYVWTFFHFYRNHWISWNYYFALCTYGRAKGAYDVYEKKTKNTNTMKTLSKVEKSMVCLNVLSYL
jgi:1,4-dihydroxy-2-naphthoate octaprenyltransferase